MSGIEFKAYVKRLLENTGWEVETAPPTIIDGVDLIARRYDEMGLKSLSYVHVIITLSDGGGCSP